MSKFAEEGKFAFVFWNNDICLSLRWLFVSIHEMHLHFHKILKKYVV